MGYRPRRMKFGIFLAPFHRVGENPTLALERDLELIEYLDRLGYDEVWIGEHHSAGRELIADPAVFIAAAAQRTRTIKLGTGVVSLPYHHPLMVADRMVLLDHMTRGRAMLGVGPGALTSDAYMMGIDPMQQRRRMNEALDAIMALLRAEGPVDMETDWFVLRDARLQLNSYTDPHLPVAVATTFTPSGPGAAGRHGIGLLSVAGIDSDRFHRTWEWVEEAAAAHGRTVDRGEWRIVIPIHLADSREQAVADIAEGYRRRAYVGDGPPLTLGASPLFGGGGTLEQAIERGSMIIGTPDDAIAAVERILELSGGFGCLLNLAHEWASTEKTLRSYELWARYVAPHFQGQLAAIHASRDWFAAKREQIFAAPGAAMAKAYEDAGKEVPEVLRRMQRPPAAPEAAASPPAPER
jgi:limonene 1,2-monooxygenase